MSLDKIKPYAKAVTGAIVAGLGAYATALDDGVTTQEWITVALAVLAGAGFVFGVPNQDPRGLKQDESVQPPVTYGSKHDAAHHDGNDDPRPTGYWGGI